MSGVSGASVFVNFETAPVHPIAISPEGKRLVVCNLPDAHLEIYSLEADPPTLQASVPVGMDPVTVRFRSESEVWVVNNMSDSINVINAGTLAVTRVISTRTRPADVVFAGKPRRAFVSCPPENILQVFDPDTGTLLKTIAIAAERPKALAVSPDGSKVYAAIFESGNGTTILAPKFSQLGHAPSAGPVDLPLGPYAGLNPPPNRGTNLYPALNTNLPASTEPPRVSLIVKKQNDARWLDDNGGDWTQIVSGTNAAFSGRVVGWDLLDHDVAVVDANTFDVSFLDHLMNICMDLAVNPVSGTVAVVGTDAINHVRYEPVLKGIFVRAELALTGPDVTNQATLVDLNPHLDYTKPQIPMEERLKSVGDPRGVVWNAAGTRLYASGMGSDNVVVFDASGKIGVSAPIPEGPTGLAFDSARNRLYVLCRFAATIAVLDPETLAVRETIRYFDPTPDTIRKGRRHFYNTHQTSGLGQAACASCHVDARFDRLAWDLGTPLGEMNRFATNVYNFVSTLPPTTNDFHPMKGPMVTQTLQDIIGHEPFHWRGDRVGLEKFNPTFVDLQAADAELTEAEMQEFEDFLATVRFPPNRLRNFDNSLASSIAVTNESSLGRGRLFKGDPLPRGNAVNGLALFNAVSLDCIECHTMPTGNGPDKFFKNGRWNTIPIGPNGEHHLAVTAVPRAELLPFKVAQLRSLREKNGFNLTGVSRSGFGFLHDGRVDTLTHFLQDGFDLTDDQQTADLAAFLLSFAGSDLPGNTNSNNQLIAPATATSLDAPAATGLQLLLTADASTLDPFIARANARTGRLDLIVRAIQNDTPRGWLYTPATGKFKPDTEAADLSRTELFSKLNGAGAVFMLVPAGAGRQMALDRDLDGALNFDEVLAGSDPADPLSLPGVTRILGSQVASNQFVFTWASPVNRPYRVLTKTYLMDAWSEVVTNTTSASLTTNAVPIGNAADAYFTVELLGP